MYTVCLAQVVLFIFQHIVPIFGQHNSQADIINNCVNSTNSTSCSHIYEQVYKSLAKSDNNFNISHALYPGRSKPSSVRVFVNVYGPNKTKDSTPAMYTWSMSCLYAAVPAVVLEVLSLGSILVAHRTQELNIHIPSFCCNISGNNKRREKIIDGMLTRVLGELQDLADSPGIQNPKLNTAKCVIQGHELNISATERSPYVRTILWCSLFFVILSSPLLSLYILRMQNMAWPDKKRINKRKDDAKGKHNEDDDEKKKKKKKMMKKKKNMAKAICLLSVFLFLLGSGTLIYVLVRSIIFLKKEEASFDITAILGVLVAYTYILLFIIIKCIHENDVKWYSYFFVVCANVTSYHFCWLMIGIMINPTWGLTVALLVCSTFAALTFAIYLYFDATDNSTEDENTEDENTEANKIHAFLFCFCGFLAVLLLVIIILFAGQSYNGKETADEVLKTTLLYFVGAFISWITWKKHSSPVGQTPPSNAKTTDGQTPPKKTEGKKNERKNDVTPL